MIINLTRQIKLIRPQGRASFPYSNSLYVDDDSRLVIDAGAGQAFGEIPEAEVDLLFLSHYHFDHTHGTSRFKRAGIMAGIQEAPGYEDVAAYIEYSGFSHWKELMVQPKNQPFIKTAGYPEDVFEKPGFREIRLSGTFQDRDSFTLGSTTVQALHTPGHTHGHYSFWFEKAGILFASDLDLSPGGPWYGEEYSNVEDLVSSVNRLIEIDPLIMLTSHRRVFKQPDDNIKQLLKEYLGVTLGREEAILHSLQEPRTIDDIEELGLVFEPLPRTQHIEFWNKMMIVKHLNRLHRMGLIEKTDTGAYIRR